MWPLIGLAVFVAAKVVKWIFNSMSEEEAERSETLREEAETIYQEYEEACRTKQADLKRWTTEKAGHWRRKLLQALSDNRDKIAPIREGLDSLYEVVRIEIGADTTSPFRRLALQYAFCRIEDAKLRLDAYAAYLDHAEAQIARVTDGAAVLKLRPTEPLLPDEWLYRGKLVVVSLDEIRKPLPRFGHRLLFGRHESRQLALAVPFGDEIPVMITGAHKHQEGAFYGCVARGALYYEHIIPGEPVAMNVTHANRMEVSGTAFDEFVKISVPVTKLTHKHMLPLPGQALFVYPDAFNITLDSNPLVPESKRRAIGASQLPPPELGASYQHPLFVRVPEKLLDAVSDSQFFSPLTQWNLMVSDPESNQYVLGKSHVRLVATFGERVTGLQVEQVIQTEHMQIGHQLPFSVTLVTDAIDIRALHWQPAIDTFRQYATQIALNDGHDAARRAQSVFMRRWQSVLDYQREAESVRAVTFDTTPIAIDDRLSTLHVSAAQMREETLDASAFDYLRQVDKDSMLRREHCLRIERWDSERLSYIPAVPERHRGSLEYELTDEGTLAMRGQFPREWQESEGRYRFRVQLPATALRRQQRALDDFIHDRLVQPALKDILLSPQSYLPVDDPFWTGREIHWQGKLSPSQREAVSMALKAKHVALIQGPPGTGKTTAIVEMLYQLFTANPNCRVLLVSQQNTAVDNALERFIQRFPDLVQTAVQVIRIGNPDKVSASLKRYQFDERYAQFVERLSQDARRKVLETGSDRHDIACQWSTVIDYVMNTPDNLLDRPTLEELSTLLLADKNLVGATCVGLSTPKGGVDHLVFDVAIIDEAGRATVPELLIPLLRCRKAILIGDHYQLPPCVSPLLREDSARDVLPFLREAFLETSFFELLFEQLPTGSKAILKEQYRMAPEIGDLVGELFYTRKKARTLFNGVPAGDWERSALMTHSLNWMHVKGRQTRPAKSRSLCNLAEADAIVHFLASVAEFAEPHTEVAVITPYAAQKKLVLDRLNAYCTTHPERVGVLGRLAIKVDTVDAFQGSEADLVCYSTVRTQGALQFLLDRKRLNVACSRARHHLVFFGDAGFLENARAGGAGENYFATILKRAHRLNSQVPVQRDAPGKRRDRQRVPA
ncbi:ATP-dependent RecD-like DNA helicase [Paraburkholderia graminis C4D1M]|uniref:Superfamily I DNA and RNA helicase and helicase subunits-like protein n=1 Tax=Paraburkholderia graminis (strain ATCC 700544 / DSM 17151 / LMG 18924 / NCIMB 13744 / C4D1M) TaxID=396598 RepID=B1GB66_PARG4|nr:AAA domain-containing protein [Paraburkholderia graminis]EDT06627.1 Superfamily I DNA and RNA helicase and helicase subunits-like protein [Paraburkholderia graminis C4D1M]CAB3737713.1 ATP-dependent RecD-like DNA helicase [Paraburkholderia graminis C4D1M]